MFQYIPNFWLCRVLCDEDEKSRKISHRIDTNIHTSHVRINVAGCLNSTPHIYRVSKQYTCTGWILHYIFTGCLNSTPYMYRVTSAPHTPSVWTVADMSMVSEQYTIHAGYLNSTPQTYRWTLRLYRVFEQYAIRAGFHVSNIFTGRSCYGP